MMDEITIKSIRAELDEWNKAQKGEQIRRLQQADYVLSIKLAAKVQLLLDRIDQLEAILEQIRDIAINNSSSYEMDDIGTMAEKALLRENPPTNSTDKG